MDFGQLLLLEFGKINPPQSISAKHQVENCLSKDLMKKKPWRSKANFLNAESINPQSICAKNKRKKKPPSRAIAWSQSRSLHGESRRRNPGNPIAIA
jgi:hypothetical protein